MKATQLIGPVVLAVALLSGLFASADGAGNPTPGEQGIGETFAYGTPVSPSGGGIDNLLLGNPAPQWSEDVRVAWFDPRPGFPCQDCKACAHFNNCVNQCRVDHGKVDWGECGSCQDALEQCKKNNNCS